MAMLLSKAQLIESKESENRGLSRRVEKMTETQRDNQLEWKRVISHMRLVKQINKPFKFIHFRSVIDCKGKRINLKWHRLK